ncbi:MAG: hypothetical protein WB729_05645 [Candidatus Sulfotelmatobacter sp.]
MIKATNVQIIKAISALYESPTPYDWELVLGAVIEGLLQDDLERLGSIDDFVETNIANCKHPTISRVAFRSALEHEVSAWQPDERAPADNVERQLRLISAFTPPSGFHKVLGQLEQRGHFILKDQQVESRSASVNDLACFALESYFSAPPQELSQFPAFESYVAFLKAQAEFGHLRGHACRRLFELGIWTVHDKLAVELISVHFDEVLSPMLDWLLRTAWHDRRVLLSRLYGESLKSTQSRHIFDSALIRHQVELVNGAEGPTLVLQSKEPLELTLETQDFLRYMATVRASDQALEVGKAFFEQLVMTEG